LRSGLYRLLQRGADGSWPPRPPTIATASFTGTALSAASFATAALAASGGGVAGEGGAAGGDGGSAGGGGVVTDPTSNLGPGTCKFDCVP